MTDLALSPLRAFPTSALQGAIRAPGDKSISHRALILAALSAGCSRITGLLTADDLIHTVGALRQCGVIITVDDRHDYVVEGLGVTGLSEPSDVINLGNSGTAARLLMGVVAGHPMQVIFTGDESLRSRPMNRVAEPLVQMGALVKTTRDGGLPALVSGAAPPLPITYRQPVPSAQVKSAVLLAGLSAPGQTTVIESVPTRDHTEKLLKVFGAQITVKEEGGESHVTLVGQPELRAQNVVVPGDPSSAAFPLVAALITPDSEVLVRGVGMNERRTGLFQCLREMGAELEITSVGSVGGEPIADLTARTSRLRAVEVSAERAPSMIDEYPILAVAAACANGSTVMHGLGELRVKESDRLTAVVKGLNNCGVEAFADGETLTVIGAGPNNAPVGAGKIMTHQDHRVAMAFLTLGLASGQAVIVDDGSMITSSYPGFVEDMTLLGATIEHLP